MTHQEVLYNRTVEYLDSQNWHYSLEEDDGIIRFGLNINSKIKNCRITILVTEKEIQTFSTCPINASEDAYPAVVEFITRANYGLKVGKFEFDYRDGEVRYQSCLPCSESVPPLKDVERCVDIGSLMFQRYGNGLVKSLMGFGNPEADIKEIEG